MMPSRALLLLSLLGACTSTGKTGDDTDANTDAVDTDVADTDVPDTDVADTDVADTDVADTDVADTDLPDTDLPDTDVADTDLDDTGNGPILDTSDTADTGDTDAPADTDLPADTDPPTDTSPPVDTDPPADTDVVFDTDLPPDPDTFDTAPWGGIDTSWPSPAADCLAVVPSTATVVDTTRTVTDDNTVSWVCKNQVLSLTGDYGTVYVETGGQVIVTGAGTLVYVEDRGYVVVNGGGRDEIQAHQRANILVLGGGQSRTIDCPNLEIDRTQAPPNPCPR